MSDSSSATLQTLAGALVGGLGGYLDSQGVQPITATQPLPQTAYGVAGVGQIAPTVSASVSGYLPLILVGALVLGAIFLLKK